ncbi:MAG: hypothetical protein ACTSVM_01750, partial [Candidatus Ranarchaeia archaeon]
ISLRLQQKKVTLRPQERKCIPVKIQIPPDIVNTTLPLVYHAKLETMHQKILTRRDERPIRVHGLGALFANYEDVETLLMENETLRILLRLDRNASIKGIDNLTHGIRYVNRAFIDAIGPPFSPNLLHYVKPKTKILQKDVLIAVEVESTPPNRAELIITKQYLLPRGASTIQVQYKITNTSNDPVSSFQLRTEINPSMLVNKATIPHLLGNLSFNIVRYHLPVNRYDIPCEEKDLMEQWIAYESTDFNQLVGYIWSKNNFLKLAFNGPGSYEGDRLYFNVPQIPPLSTVTLDPIYLYTGPGDWREIRHRWTKLVCHEPRGEYGNPDPQTFDLVIASFEPSPTIIESPTRTQLGVSLTNRRTINLTGQLTIRFDPPIANNKGGFLVKEINQQNLFQDTIDLRLPKDKFNMIYTGHLHFSSNIFNHDFEDYLVVLGGEGEVKISELETEDRKQSCWQIDNGRLRLLVAPDYTGSLVRLETKKNDSVLETGYPEPGVRLFFNPWFGGIHPFLYHEGIFFGYLWKEKFDATPVELNKWKGVRVKATLTEKNVDHHGVSVAVDYLTKPNSNIILVHQQLKGIKSGIVKVEGGMAIQPKIGPNYFSTLTYPNPTSKQPCTFNLTQPALLYSSPLWVVYNSQFPSRNLIIKSLSLDTRSSNNMLGTFSQPKFGAITFGLNRVVLRPKQVKRFLYTIIVNAKDKNQVNAYTRLNSDLGLWHPMPENIDL